MEELFKLIAVGGDVGIWVILFVLWKFDRRLFRIELKVFPEAKKA